MDDFYPWEEAKLDRLNKARMDNPSPEEIYLANIDLSVLQIVQRGEPRSWRLSYFNTEDGHMDDAYIRIQGILCSKILPPVSKPINQSAGIRMRPHLRQAVTITGLGNDVFMDCLSNMEKTYLAFENHFPADALEKWQPASFSNQIAFDAHARYFSPKHFVPSAESIPFHTLVDPNGVLENMRGDDMVHAADNEVDYFHQFIGSDGMPAYKRISPSDYRIGDIVEITLIIVAYPTKGQRYKLVPLLRGMLLVNQQFREHAAILRMRNRYTPAAEQVMRLSTKRRSAYIESDDVKDTERKMSRMSL